MQWKSPARWEELKKGINCPMCLDFPLPENPFSFLVIELQQSFVRLPKNQYYRGWTIVGLKKHANELFDLSDRQLLEYWQDVSLVAQALDQIYSPAKIDYCIFGHHCPHLHCHLFIQSYQSDPSVPLKPDEKEVILTTDEYVSMISLLRSSITNLQNAKKAKYP